MQQRSTTAPDDPPRMATFRSETFWAVVVLFDLAAAEAEEEPSGCRVDGEAGDPGGPGRVGGLCMAEDGGGLQNERRPPSALTDCTWVIRTHGSRRKVISNERVTFSHLICSSETFPFLDTVGECRFNQTLAGLTNMG